MKSEQKDCSTEKFSAVPLLSLFLVQTYFSRLMARRITDIFFWTGVLINLNLIKTANEAKMKRKTSL